MHRNRRMLVNLQLTWGLLSELKDLYYLLRKGVEWSSGCQKAFEKRKKMSVDNDLLQIYDPNKPIIVAKDASPYGVGAVSSHLVDGVDRYVCI